MRYDEASLKGFVVASISMDKDTSVRLIDSILANSATDSIIFREISNFLGKSFGDPNSPFRNERLYDSVLLAEVRSEWYSSEEKIIFEKQFTLTLQNRVGAIANDFFYRTKSGKRSSLYELNAQYALVFFYNPECEACKEMKERLSKSPIVIKMVATGRLKILAIYADKDTSIWKRHLQEQPATWLQGSGEGDILFTNKIYDLRAIPTIYLLDSQKSVVLKDCENVPIIEDTLLRRNVDRP